MIVIGEKLIIKFIKIHKNAESWLSAWRRIVSRASWKSIVEVKLRYPHTDAVGVCTVFNIKDNHYRLITKIDYRAQAILIKDILTHAEYNKEKWKKGCGR